MTLRAAKRALLAALAVGGCARALPPPGGEADELPPQVIGTEPEPLALLEDLGSAVVFRFDERISERGIEQSVLVSPETGAPRVDKGRSELRVRLPGGWQPGQVYRVVLLPGVQDLFGNARNEPASLVFSTGPPIPNTAVAGVVFDRITGRPANQAVVRALRTADSVAYSAVGDSAAFFALTHLPTGSYELTAFIDQNRNRRRDAGEPASPPELVSLNAETDTTVHVLAVVPADTTPPALTGANARDSTDVRLTFDDYLDPDVPLQDIEVSLFLLPDTLQVPGTPRLARVDEFEARARERQDSLRAAARADSLAALPPSDSLPPDTAVLVVPPGPPRPPGPDAAAPSDTLAGPRPARELVLIPLSPLRPGARYLVRVRGLANVTGLGGGSGEAEFDVPERPAAADTTRRPRPDTASARPDTTSARLRPARAGARR